MAEDSDLERTEPASERRLEQAREEGDVPRSRELATCTVLLAAGIGFWIFGEGMVRQLNGMLVKGLSLERDLAFDFDRLAAHIASGLWEVMIAFAPLAGWEIAQPATHVSEAERDRQFQTSHNLRAIMQTGQRGAALIDNRLIAVGQSLDGYKLIRIDSLRVIFAGEKGTVTLTLPDAGRAENSENLP